MNKKTLAAATLAAVLGITPGMAKAQDLDDILVTVAAQLLADRFGMTSNDVLLDSQLYGTSVYDMPPAYSISQTTQADVLEIMRLRQLGYSWSQIANMVGMPRDDYEYAIRRGDFDTDRYWAYEMNRRYDVPVPAVQRLRRAGATWQQAHHAARIARRLGVDPMDVYQSYLVTGSWNYIFTNPNQATPRYIYNDGTWMRSVPVNYNRYARYDDWDDDDWDDDRYDRQRYGWPYETWSSTVPVIGNTWYARHEPNYYWNPTYRPVTYYRAYTVPRRVILPSRWFAVNDRWDRPIYAPVIVTRPRYVQPEAWNRIVVRPVVTRRTWLASLNRERREDYLERLEDRRERREDYLERLEDQRERREDYRERLADRREQSTTRPNWLATNQERQRRAQRVSDWDIKRTPATTLARKTETTASGKTVRRTVVTNPAQTIRKTMVKGEGKPIKTMTRERTRETLRREAPKQRLERKAKVRTEVRAKDRPTVRTQKRADVRAKQRNEVRAKARTEQRANRRTEVRAKNRTEVRSKARANSKARIENQAKTRTQVKSQNRQRAERRVEKRSQPKRQFQAKNRDTGSARIRAKRSDGGGGQAKARLATKRSGGGRNRK